MSPGTERAREKGHRKEREEEKEEEKEEKGEEKEAEHGGKAQYWGGEGGILTPSTGPCTKNIKSRLHKGLIKLCFLFDFLKFRYLFFSRLLP